MAGFLDLLNSPTDHEEGGENTMSNTYAATTATPEPTTITITGPVVVAEMDLGKETPGTYKFVEDAPKGQPPISGSFYLKKHVVEGDLDEAVRIRVYVERVR
jgi:hypothetical protein